MIILQQKSSKILQIAFFPLILASLFVLTNVLLDATKISLVSQLNNTLFSAILSLLLSTFIFWYLTKSNFLIRFNSKISFSYFIFILIVTLVSLSLYIRFGVYSEYGSLAFQPWSAIPVFDSVIIIAMYCLLLYVPAYVAHKIFLCKYSLIFLEQLVFYPLISLLVFGSLNFLVPFFGTVFSLRFTIMPLLLGALVCAYILSFLRNKKHSLMTSKNVNLLEVLILVCVIIFAFFILFSAIGGTNAFIKGDAAGGVENVGYINKQGLSGYMNAPLTEHYPVFYFCSWSTITELLPFPYINSVILIEFFNIGFMILSFFALTKLFFVESKERIFATIVLVVVSGFSWFYLFNNPPTSLLSTSQFHTYSGQIFSQFGTESGAKISFIYADDHALVRLWSLGLIFTSIFAFGNYLKNKGRGYLVIFMAGLIQIALGHSVELVLMTLLIFALFYLRNGHLSKGLIFSFGISALIMLLFAVILGYDTSIYYLIFLPMLGLIFAKVCRVITCNKYSEPLFEKKKLLLSILTLVFVFYYGLSLIAFITMPQAKIETPLSILWYALPIEFGFGGLFFVLALIRQSKLNWNNIDSGLKFIIISFILLLFTVILLNFVNMKLMFTIVPAYMVPYYFLPLFALSSAYLIKNKRFPKITRKSKSSLIFFLVLLFLILISSFSHVLSASYWNGSGWAKESSSINSLSVEDTNVINFLYSLQTINGSSLIGYLPENQLAFSAEGSIFQTTVRYNVTNLDNLILLSGMRFPQKLSMSVLQDTTDLREVAFLKQIYPFEYVVVDHNTTNFLADYCRSTLQPIFESNQYLIYNLTNIGDLNRVRNPEKVILVNKVLFDGNLTIDVNLYSKILTNVSGTISPLENGAFAVKTDTNNKSPEESSNYLPLWDKNGTAFWSTYAFGVGNVSIPLINNDTTTEIGYNKLNINVTKGSYLAWSLQHEYSNGQDWSSYDYITFWWYGKDTGSNVNLDLATNPWTDSFRYSFVDDYYGWKRITFRLNEPTAVLGLSSLSNITRISIGRSAALGSGDFSISIMGLYNDYSVNFNATNLSINGETSLVNLRSTWNYFPEALNIAQKIVLNGTTNFAITNTFDNARLYLTSFENYGSYAIYPPSWQVTENTAKVFMEDYAKAKDVSPLNVLVTLLGLTWLCLFLPFSFLYLSKKIKIKIIHRRKGDKRL